MRSDDPRLVQARATASSSQRVVFPKRTRCGSQSASPQRSRTGVGCRRSPSSHARASGAQRRGDPGLTRPPTRSGERPARASLAVRAVERKTARAAGRRRLRPRGCPTAGALACADPPEGGGSAFEVLAPSHDSRGWVRAVQPARGAPSPLQRGRTLTPPGWPKDVVPWFPHEGVGGATAQGAALPAAWGDGSPSHRGAHPTNYSFQNLERIPK
jgi:hypothetical protein